MGEARFRPVAGLSRAVEVLLGLHVALAIVGVALREEERRILRALVETPLRVDPDRAFENGDALDTLFSVKVVVFLATAVVFMWWLTRCYGNLRAFHARQRFPTWWAVAGWFVPFLNLVRPKQVVNDIWTGTDRSRPPTTRDNPRVHSKLSHAWWGAFLVSGWLVRYGRGATETNDPQRALDLSPFILTGEMLQAAAAVLAIVLVARIAARQTACAHDVLLGEAPWSPASDAGSQAPITYDTTSRLTVPAALAALVLLLAVALVAGRGRGDGALAAAGPGGSGDGANATRATTALAPGDCIPEGQVSESLTFAVEIVPCEAPHTHEVVGVVTYPETTSFPGDDELLVESEASCRVEFERYASVPIELSGLEILQYLPTRESWGAGDRAVACLAEADVPLEGSLEGATAADAPFEREEITSFLLEEGDCLPASVDFDAFELPLVDCSEPHLFEVYARTTVPGATGSFPGDAEINAFSDEHCVETLEEFLGGPLEDAGGDYTFFAPNEETWAELDDRSVVCLFESSSEVEGTAASSLTT